MKAKKNLKTYKKKKKPLSGAAFGGQGGRETVFDDHPANVKGRREKEEAERLLSDGTTNDRDQRATYRQRSGSPGADPSALADLLVTSTSDPHLATKGSQPFETLLGATSPQVPEEVRRSRPKSAPVHKSPELRREGGFQGLPEQLQSGEEGEQPQYSQQREVATVAAPGRLRPASSAGLQFGTARVGEPSLANITAGSPQSVGSSAHGRWLARQNSGGFGTTGTSVQIAERRGSPPRQKRKASSKEVVDVLYEILADSGNKVQDPRTYDSVFSAIEYMPVDPIARACKTGWREFFLDNKGGSTARERKTKLAPLKNSQKQKAQETRGKVREQRFEAALERLQRLWNELRLPKRDRKYFMKSFCEPPVTLDKERQVASQLSLLTRHRACTGQVLRAICDREGCLADLTELFLHSGHATGTDPTAGPSSGAAERDFSVKFVTLLAELRNATLRVIEAVLQWRTDLWQPKPFFWRQVNYLEKLSYDVAFLDCANGRKLLGNVGIELEDLKLLHFKKTSGRQKSKSTLDKTTDNGSPKNQEFLDMFWGLATAPGSQGVTVFNKDTTAFQERVQRAVLAVLVEPQLQVQVQEDQGTMVKRGCFIPTLRWVPPDAVSMEQVASERMRSSQDSSPAQHRTHEYMPVARNPSPSPDPGERNAWVKQEEALAMARANEIQSDEGKTKPEKSAPDSRNSSSASNSHNWQSRSRTRSRTNSRSSDSSHGHSASKKIEDLQLQEKICLGKTKVRVEFSTGVFEGLVKEKLREGTYLIEYEDGEMEEMGIEELQTLIVPEEEKQVENGKKNTASNNSDQSGMRSSTQNKLLSDTESVSLGGIRSEPTIPNSTPLQSGKKNVVENKLHSDTESLSLGGLHSEVHVQKSASSHGASESVSLGGIHSEPAVLSSDGRNSDKQSASADGSDSCGKPKYLNNQHSSLPSALRSQTDEQPHISNNYGLNGNIMATASHITEEKESSSILSKNEHIMAYKSYTTQEMNTTDTEDSNHSNSSNGNDEDLENFMGLRVDSHDSDDSTASSKATRRKSAKKIDKVESQPQPALPSGRSLPQKENYSPGDNVEVFTEEHKEWLPGIISEMNDEQGTCVEHNKGDKVWVVDESSIRKAVLKPDPLNEDTQTTQARETRRNTNSSLFDIFSKDESGTPTNITVDTKKSSSRDQEVKDDAYHSQNIAQQPKPEEHSQITALEPKTGELIEKGHGEHSQDVGQMLQTEAAAPPLHESSKLEQSTHAPYEDSGDKFEQSSKNEAAAPPLHESSKLEQSTHAPYEDSGDKFEQSSKNEASMQVSGHLGKDTSVDLEYSKDDFQTSEIEAGKSQIQHSSNEYSSDLQQSSKEVKGKGSQGNPDESAGDLGYSSSFQQSSGKVGKTSSSHQASSSGDHGYSTEFDEGVGKVSVSHKASTSGDHGYSSEFNDRVVAGKGNKGSGSEDHGYSSEFKDGGEESEDNYGGYSTEFQSSNDAGPKKTPKRKDTTSDQEYSDGFDD